MFDFLDEKAANVTRVRPKRVSGEKASRGGGAGRSLPIIRKPVPVSESGPLRPPSPNGPGEVDDFAFLAESDFRDEAFDTSRSGTFAVEADERSGGWLRPMLYLLAFALVVAGGIVTAWPRLQQSGVLDGLLGGEATRTADAPALGTSDEIATGTPPARPADTDVAAPATAPAVERTPAAVGDAPRSLGERFRDEVGQIEALVADGRLDEAESAIAGLDRAVYGYGFAEFSALEERIASSRSGEEAPAAAGGDAARTEAPGEPAADAGNADAIAAAEAVAEAERAEVARAAAEADRLETRRLEIERAADAERRAAAERTAEAERVEAERAEAERVEAERIEAERAAAADVARRERLAAERAASEAEVAASRTEAREAAQRRAEALAAERETAAPAVPAAPVDADAAATTAAAAAAAAEARRLEADARATDLRIAEQRAAALAEERRLASLEAAAAPRARQTIDDDDLQIVYASLLELKNAFEDRDIGRVIALSDPPGGRVQQLLQVFANSATVETRITNVSARPADDTVTGTLRIEDVRRADGSAIGLPAELASIALTSTREGDGWSTLSW